MSVTIALELHAKSGGEAELTQMIRNFLPDTRARAGCEALEVVHDLDNAGAFLIWERWSTREDYMTYFNWRQERGDVDKIGALCQEPPLLRFFGPVSA